MAREVTAEWDPIRGQSTLLELLSVKPVELYRRIGSAELRDANLTALFQAEMLAAAVGVIPVINTAKGPGIATLGAARERILKPDQWTVPGGRLGFLNSTPLTEAQVKEVQTIYLGAQHSVRVLNANARKPRSGTPRLLPSAASGAPVQVATGVVVAIAAVAIAAVVATAWYASRQGEAEVEAQKAVDVANSSSLAKLAGDQLAATGSIDPAIIKALAPGARQERGMSIAAPVIGITIAVVVVVGGVATVRYLAA